MADNQAAVSLTYDLVPAAQTQSKLAQQAAALERNFRFKSPFGDAVRGTRDFTSELDRANQRVITLGASFAVLSNSLRILKDIAKSTIEVEKAFTEINAVFQLSAQGLDQFSKQLFNAARNTSQSFERAAEAAKEFSRQGLTSEETIKRTTDALILTRLANIDVAKSVDVLTASINGFQKSALTSSEIINKLATVDSKFAVSSNDLAEALSRSGAAASDAGINFDQLIGLVTAAQQTTARGGAVIGNALKTIFTRIERRETVEAMESLGISVRETSGEMLTALPLLQNFAQAYDGLEGSLKKQAAALVGGVFQINILKAVLGDLAKANGIAAQATDISANATNEAILRNEALNKSLDSLLVKLGVTAKQIGSNIGSQSFAGPLKGLLNIVADNPIVKALQDASGKAESIGGQIAEKLLQGIGGSLVYGLGPLVGLALSKIVKNTTSNLFKDFQDLSGLKTQGQQQAAIQSEVVSLYRAGGAALQQQLAAMTSLTEKAALLQRYLTAASASTPAAQIAGALYQSGYRAQGKPKGAGGYVPGAAGGYIPHAAGGIGPFGLRRGATEIGRGSFGAVLKSPDANVVFKRFLGGQYPERTEGDIRSEYAISKLAEQMGLPVAKVFGSANRSVKRRGLYKEYVEGTRGDRLPEGQRFEVQNKLIRLFQDAGIDPKDLRGPNFVVRPDGSPVVVDPGAFQLFGNQSGGARMPAYNKAYYSKARGYIPGANTGYLPLAEESAAIASGVGGAPANARAVYLAGFNRGNGEKGIVANTSEFIVPTAAGSAIFNREMIAKHGLPPGATPVGARGYVPSAAPGFQPGDLQRLLSTATGPQQAFQPNVTTQLAPIPTQELEKLNALFKTLASASTVQGATAIEKEIKVFASSLEKLSKQKVLGEATATVALVAKREQDELVANARKAKDFEKAKLEEARQQAQALRLSEKKQRDLERLAEFGEKRRGVISPTEIGRLDDSTARNLAAIQQKNDKERLRAIAESNLELKKRRSVESAEINPGGKFFPIITSKNQEIIPSLQRGRRSFSLYQLPTKQGEVYGDVEGMGVPWKPYSGPIERNTAAVARYGSFVGRAENANRIRSFSPPKSRPSIEQIEALIPANEAIEPFGKLPPSVLEGLRARKPTIRQRVKGAFNPQNLSFAAAFGLPFVGNAIDEGRGGTASGIARGIAGSGLTAAGTGAAFGLSFGPAGAGIGAGIGAVVGGIYGAFKKITKSFEEFAQEVQDANDKISSQVQAVNEIFDLKEQMAQARRSGVPQAKVDDIGRRIDESFAKVTNRSVRNRLLTEIEDPNVRTNIGQDLNAERTDTTRAPIFSSNAKNALDSGGFFGFDDKAAQRLIATIRPTLASLSKEETNKLRELTLKNPVAAFESVATKAGVSNGDIDQFLSKTRPTGGTLGVIGNIATLGNLRVYENEVAKETIDFLGAAVLDGLHSLAKKGVSPLSKAISDAGDKTLQFRQSLESLTSQYQIQSRLIQVEAEGTQQLARTRQGIATSSPSLTEQGRIDLQSRFERENLTTQFGAQREASVFGGRAALLEQLRVQKVDTNESRAAVQGVSSVADLEALRNRVNKPGGIQLNDATNFTTVIDNLIENLTVLNETEKKQITVNALTNRLLSDQLQKSRRFEGALEEDSGAFLRAQEAFEASKQRGDPSDVQANALLALTTATQRLYQRMGIRSEGEADTNILRDETVQGLEQRKRRAEATLGLGDEFRIGQSVEDQDLDFRLKLSQSKVDLNAAKRLGLDEGTTRDLRTQRSDLLLESQRRGGTLDEGDERIKRLEQRERSARSSRFASGSEISRSSLDTARERGLQGDSLGSLTGGFTSVFAGIKRDLNDLSDLGAQVAQSLSSNLGGAWGDFVTGAKKGKDAFRDFLASVTGEASRALGTKAFSSLLSLIPGFAGAPAGATGGLFTGKGFVGYASGGTVPAMVMGGEYYVSPQAARGIGYDKLRQLNRYADGGVVPHYALGGPIRGGSGVRDDIPTRLQPGSFILRKSATQRLGADYLNDLVAGRVQHRWIGGAITGALIGGGVGYVTGGKKGAIGGAILGGIAGGAYSWKNAQITPEMKAYGLQAEAAQMSQGMKIGLGLGASAGLGLLAAGINAKGAANASGSISLSQVPALRAQLEADQQKQLNGRGAGQQVFLSMNPQGGYSLAGMGDEPATRRWAEGGEVGGSTMPTARMSTGGEAAQVSIKIEINNNGQTSSSTNGKEPFGEGSAGRLEKTVKGWVQEEIVRQNKPDGFFAQRGRFVNAG